MLVSRNNSEDGEGTLSRLEKLMFGFWGCLGLSRWAGPVITVSITDPMEGESEGVQSTTVCCGHGVAHMHM